MVSQMAEKLDKIDTNHDYPNETLHGSIHAPNGPSNIPSPQPSQPNPPKQTSTPKNPQPENPKNNLAPPKTPLN